MCKVLAIVMHKGGVGKTVSAVNIAANLAEAGQRTLVIDMDPQANLTYALDLDNSTDSPYTLPHLLDCALDGESPEDLDPYLCPAENFTVIRGDMTLANLELRLAMTERYASATILREVMGGLRARFDYILIDTPPNLSLLSINAMAAADKLLFPCPAEMFGPSGLGQIFETFQAMWEYNPQIEIGGVFFTKYKKRKKISRLIVEELREGCVGRAHVFDTIIPMRADANQSIGHCCSLLRYRRSGELSRQYTSLTREILRQDGVVA